MVLPIIRINIWLKIGGIMNKRGLIIEKEQIVEFNENEDHDINLGHILLKDYSQFKDELDIINNIPRVTVFKGCALITYADDIVILNTFDSQLLVFLPEDISVITNFQKESLTSILTADNLKMNMTIEGLPKDPFAPNTIYTKETLLSCLAKSKHRH